MSSDPYSSSPSSSSPIPPSSSSPSSSSPPALYPFGRFQLSPFQIFYNSPHSYVSVNVRPVVTGHSLVISRRCVRRINELSDEEVADLMITAKFISIQLNAFYLEKHNETKGFTFVIQDGEETGQTVHHVHLHILPRRKGDFQRNDDIYDAIEGKIPLNKSTDTGRVDSWSNNRSGEEMQKEAKEFREFIEKKTKITFKHINDYIEK